MDKTDNNTEDFLAKAARDDFYAEQLADLVERQGLMKAPVNLKSSIMERSRQLDIQVIAKSNLASKRLELFYYGLKLSAAVAVSLCFILIMPTLNEGAHRAMGQDLISRRQEQLSDTWVPIHERFSDQIKDLSGAAQEFFFETLNMEVFLHDN